MLEVQDLHAFYGKSHILQGVDMHVDALKDVALAVIGVQILDLEHQAASSPR